MWTVKFIVKLVLGVVWNALIFGVLLFLPAGTLHWPRAWWFLAIVVAAGAISMLAVFPGREDLLKERFKPPIQKGQPVADRIVLLALLVAFLVLIVSIPLDVFRFHFMSQPGPLVSWLGLVLFIAGWWIMSLAMKENTFAAPVVRHQAERHQIVVDSGVYAVVRHPMYVGGLLLFVGMPLWLESYAASVLAIVPIGLIIVRITIEERLLCRELPGYTAYTAKVRYRLLPGLW
jgi:protein-S-isoprenylcysteine O-methyltransferase Ste14